MSSTRKWTWTWTWTCLCDLLSCFTKIMDTTLFDLNTDFLLLGSNFVSSFGKSSVTCCLQIVTDMHTLCVPEHPTQCSVNLSDKVRALKEEEKFPFLQQMRHYVRSSRLFSTCTSTCTCIATKKNPAAPVSSAAFHQQVVVHVLCLCSEGFVWLLVLLLLLDFMSLKWNPDNFMSEWLPHDVVCQIASAYEVWRPQN